MQSFFLHAREEEDLKIQAHKAQSGSSGRALKQPSSSTHCGPMPPLTCVPLSQRKKEATIRGGAKSFPRSPARSDLNSLCQERVSRRGRGKSCCWQDTKNGFVALFCLSHGRIVVVPRSQMPSDVVEKNLFGQRCLRSNRSAALTTRTGWHDHCPLTRIPYNTVVYAGKKKSYFFFFFHGEESRQAKKESTPFSHRSKHPARCSP